MSDFSELRIEGSIATPEDEGWEEARRVWNLAADLRPAAVVFAQNAGDVAATVGFAAAHELRVAGQGTGHGAAGLADLEDAILIKTERMRGIEIDAEARMARLEAGVLSLELGEAAQAHRMCS